MTLPATTPAPPPQPLDRRKLVALTFLVFASSGTIHFQTPLLGQLGAALGASPSAIGWIPTLTFGGLFAGTLFLVPLGDRVDKRSLILVQGVALLVSLLAMACARSIGFAAAASFMIGFCCGLSQHAIPLASEFARPTERGRVVGTVLSGVFMGLLFARVMSGQIAEHFSWRWSYVAGAAVLTIAGTAAMLLLPSVPPPKTRLSYVALLRSVGALYVTNPRIRNPSLVQFFTGVCYGAFWATIAGMLLSVHGYGPAIAGLIGIPGAAGILIARPAGRWMDRHGIGPVVTAGVATITAAYVVFGFAGASIAFVIAGVALLDCGLRATMVANQTAVINAASDARSRATTIFTAHVWGGNSMGAMIASFAYAHWGWQAVCVLGAAASLIALTVARVTNRR